MTTDQETILLIKGTISGLSAPEQEKVKFCSGVIEGLIKEYSTLAILAIALKGAELQDE